MKKVLLPLLLIAVVGFSRTAGPTQLYRENQILTHNINQVEMCISNFGKFGQTETGDAGCWWPTGSGHNYIYGAGPWFGTIVDGDTLVTIGYGPSRGNVEYGPGLEGMSVSDPNAIIYFYPTPWPPPVDPFPMAPQTPLSHQDSWCVIKDTDETTHDPGDTRPIGLEVYQTVYAWNLGTTKDIIFVKYEVKNVSGDTLTDCYFGVCTDNDIGNESGPAANDRIAGIVGRDYVFADTTLWIDNLGYQWQEDIEAIPPPPWWAGVIGFDYLQSPYDLVEGEDKDGDGILDQYEMDSAYFATNVPDSLWDADLDGTPDWRDPSQIPQMGMTAFKRFTLTLEPTVDNERYITLAGNNFITGAYEPYDTAAPPPSDQRFLQCSGPFTLPSDETAIVLVAIMFAEWHDIYPTPDSAIVWADHMAQFIYNMNWLLPGPPPPPTLTCIPGDAQITLIWECEADPTSTAWDPVRAADPYFEVVGDPGSGLYDPNYKQYDFEGYGVWKSMSGTAGDWELLARYDLYNDVVFEDTTQPDSIRIRADNTGVVHYYIDDDVRNGFTYYYSITAFDYNFVTTVVDTDTVVTPIWFESGKIKDTTVARRDPADYIAGAVSIDAVYGNPLLVDNNIGVVITYPMQMTDEPFYLDFQPIVYDDGDPKYAAVLLNANEDSLGGASATLVAGDATFSELGTRNGISVTAFLQREDIPSSQSIFDRIEGGPYYVLPVTMQTNWAYRGNGYEVHWIIAYGSDSVNSVIVIDIQSGDTIPFKPYMENPATDSLADGWCFRSATQATDTLVYGTPANGTKNLYICGGKFSVAFGWMNDEPRPLEGVVWIVYADPAFGPAPANARLLIDPTPAQYGIAEVELNVKVTPNPYLVHNEWQQSFDLRRLRFINLPSECTIRIFNLNGELVKTLLHTHTFDPEEGAEEILGSAGGDEWWDLLSDNRQLIASGLYIFHIQSNIGEQIGKFVVIR